MAEKTKNHIMTFYKDKMPSILLTGACGFVGSNIYNRLVEEGYSPVALDNLRFGNSSNIQGSFILDGFENLSEEFINEFDILVHCATSNIIYAMDHPVETFQNNATNTIKLFKKFRGRIIYTSTASVYGQADVIPTPEDAEIKTNNSYDQSKYIAELFLQQRGNYTTLRLSNVYGFNQRPDNPFCGVIGKLVYGILNKEKIKVNGSGLQTRDYTLVDDVVDAIMIVINKEALNTEINIATGVETSIIQLCDSISCILKTEANIQKIESRKIDGIYRRCLDVQKASRLLGWKPKTSLEEGVKKTILWMKNLK